MPDKIYRLIFQKDDGTEESVEFTAPQGPKGEQGIQGEKGETGVQGPAGQNGKDGVSATHSWNGTTLTVTSASGTSSANLKGEKGDTGATGPKGDKGDTGATGPAGKNGADGYTPVRGTDYWTAADKAEIVAMVIESLGGNPIFGIVDENNNIVVSGNLPDGTYSIKYEMENGNTVNIGNLVLDSNVYYTVKNTLTQCITSNSATQVVQGCSYSATISANSGYEMSSIKVTMGGSDISSSAVSGGKITIANATGNIVITAVATEVATAPKGNLADPTSADWLTDTRLATAYGYGKTHAGSILTNYIPVQRGDVLRVKGLNLFGIVDTQHATIGCYTSTDKTADATGKYNSYDKLYVKTSISSSTSGEGVKDGVSVNGDVYTYTILMRNGAQFGSGTVNYIRISAPLAEGYTANDVVITVNEEIVVTPTYMNLFDPSKATINYRYSSNGALTAQDGYIAYEIEDFTKYIPFTDDTKIYIKGATFQTDGKGRVFSYKADGTQYSAASYTSMTIKDEGNGVESISGLASTFVSSIVRMKMCPKVSDSAITTADIQNIVVTIDEPIT